MGETANKKLSSCKDDAALHVALSEIIIDLLDDEDLLTLQNRIMNVINFRYGDSIERTLRNDEKFRHLFNNHTKKAESPHFKNCVPANLKAAKNVKYKIVPPIRPIAPKTNITVNIEKAKRDRSNNVRKYTRKPKKKQPVLTDGSEKLFLSRDSQIVNSLSNKPELSICPVNTVKNYLKENTTEKENEISLVKIKKSDHVSIPNKKSIKILSNELIKEPNFFRNIKEKLTSLNVLKKSEKVNDTSDKLALLSLNEQEEKNKSHQKKGSNETTLKDKLEETNVNTKEEACKKPFEANISRKIAFKCSNNKNDGISTTNIDSMKKMENFVSFDENRQKCECINVTSTLKPENLNSDMNILGEEVLDDRKEIKCVLQECEEPRKDQNDLFIVQQNNKDEQKLEMSKIIENEQSENNSIIFDFVKEVENREITVEQELSSYSINLKEENKELKGTNLMEQNIFICNTDKSGREMEDPEIIENQEVLAKNHVNEEKKELENITIKHEDIKTFLVIVNEEEKREDVEKDSNQDISEFSYVNEKDTKKIDNNEAKKKQEKSTLLIQLNEEKDINGNNENVEVKDREQDLHTTTDLESKENKKDEVIKIDEGKKEELNISTSKTHDYQERNEAKVDENNYAVSTIDKDNKKDLIDTQMNEQEISTFAKENDTKEEHQDIEKYTPEKNGYTETITKVVINDLEEKKIELCKNEIEYVKITSDDEENYKITHLAANHSKQEMPNNDEKRKTNGITMQEEFLVEIHSQNNCNLENKTEDNINSNILLKVTYNKENKQKRPLLVIRPEEIEFSIENIDENKNESENNEIRRRKTRSFKENEDDYSTPKRMKKKRPLLAIRSEEIKCSIIDENKNESENNEIGKRKTRSFKENEDDYSTPIRTRQKRPLLAIRPEEIKCSIENIDENKNKSENNEIRKRKKRSFEENEDDYSTPKRMKYNLRSSRTERKKRSRKFYGHTEIVTRSHALSA